MIPDGMTPNGGVPKGHESDLRDTPFSALISKKKPSFGKMEVPPNQIQKERFLCTFNIPWTNFACQWT